ncbi:MAG: 4-hydroxyphenylpyruvate dioxygenase [Deltaproteobacteria bacterium]|nr:MAG: 4-hydroxyphenylpyruvate dioxygenase [Deltaproteobacteria bacterium]
MSATSSNNPIGLHGIEFVEYASPNPKHMEDVFVAFGFSRLMTREGKAIDLYRQNDIHFLLNQEAGTFGDNFQKEHGPSICAMGWRVEDANAALEEAVRRGARPFEGDASTKSVDLPAIYGIGDSLIYFTDHSYQGKSLYDEQFVVHAEMKEVPAKGFLSIDHLTNNVYKGTMETWSNFYKDVFGFTEVRTFDIKGKKTGLQSYALQSPCKNFCIPINEGNEDKSQIEEYLRDYHGPGIQHLAFLTHDLIASLDQLEGSGIDTLDIHEDYYVEAFQRVPQVTEDRNRIRHHQILVDGDEDGYLLQIFTQNLFGPIFIELIQRKNHNSFGEGNFQALFESIERDQERRGVL